MRSDESSIESAYRRLLIYCFTIRIGRIEALAQK